MARDTYLEGDLVTLNASILVAIEFTMRRHVVFGDDGGHNRQEKGRNGEFHCSG